MGWIRNLLEIFSCLHASRLFSEVDVSALPPRPTSAAQQHPANDSRLCGQTLCFTRRMTSRNHSKFRVRPSPNLQFIVQEVQQWRTLFLFQKKTTRPLRQQLRRHGFCNDTTLREKTLVWSQHCKRTLVTCSKTKVDCSTISIFYFREKSLKFRCAKTSIFHSGYPMLNEYFTLVSSHQVLYRSRCRDVRVCSRGNICPRGIYIAMNKAAGHQFSSFNMGYRFSLQKKKKKSKWRDSLADGNQCFPWNINELVDLCWALCVASSWKNYQAHFSYVVKSCAHNTEKGIKVHAWTLTTHPQQSPERCWFMLVDRFARHRNENILFLIGSESLTLQIVNFILANKPVFSMLLLGIVEISFHPTCLRRGC